jgi:hypothetical protein
MNNLFVDLVGGIIVAKVIGPLTEEIIRSRHAQVIRLALDTGCSKVLLDGRRTELPTDATADLQRALNPSLKILNLRIAILVTKTAQTNWARHAYINHEHQVFRDDIVSAVEWLNRS